MPSLSALVIPIAISVGAAGVLLVLTPRLLAGASGKKSGRKALEFDCTVCQQSLVIPAGQLERIPTVEAGLIVRERPEAVGRPLVEYRCPYCEALHIFITDTSPPAWIVTNPYEAQSRTNHCPECRQPLKRAGWPKGAFEGRPEEAPGLDARHGLVCPRCGAVCCVGCCRDFTRNRTSDGSLLCPRCSRGPIDKIHHF